MMNPFISCFVYVLDALIYDTFFSRVCARRFSYLLCLCIGLPLFQIASIINLLLCNNIWINTTAMIAISTVYVCLCYRETPKTALCYSILLTALALGLELFAILGISLWIHVDVTGYYDNLFVLFVELLACKAPFFLVLLVLANLSSKSPLQKTPLSLLVYPAATMICLFVFWYICLIDDSSRRIQFFISLASGILFISTILLFHTFQHAARKDSDLIRIQGENVQLKMERDYYDILERQNEALMRYAHDANKHLMAIQELSEDPRINEYVSMLSGQLKTYTRTCHTGNKLLDVMLSRYLLDSSLRGIRFRHEVKTCSLSGVADLDLVAILGNLMDNAMLAAEHSAEKTVSLETGVRNTYSVIILKNSCDKPPLSQGRKLMTTKENTRFHGHGLKNVAKTLEKYQGDYQWSYSEEDHTFTVTVMIKENQNAFPWEEDSSGSLESASKSPN